jgi:hypothetical protein
MFCNSLCIIICSMQPLTVYAAFVDQQMDWTALLECVGTVIVPLDAND